MDKFVVSIPKGLGKRQNSSQSSTSSGFNSKKLSRSRNALGNTSKKLYHQTYIDIGQKSFGVNKTCSLCGMIYVIGEIDDEKKHSSFCKQTSKMPCLPSLSNHRILSDFSGQGQIIQFNSQKKIHTDIIRQVIKDVEQDLGTPSEFFDINDPNCATYLFVKEGDLSIVGFLMVEKIDRRRLVKLTIDTDITTIYSPAIPSKNENEDENLVNSARQCLGIRLIWTRKSFRHQAIASKLVDVARRFFIFGKLVSIDETAFSQPTKNGLEFALSYCNSDCIWGYS